MPRDQHTPASAPSDPPSTPALTGPEKPALLSQRTTLILFIAIVSGIGVGMLSYLAEKSVPTAILHGLGAAATCTTVLHALME